MSDVIPEVTTEMLQAFAEAWNRHDVDALMAENPFRSLRFRAFRHPGSVHPSYVASGKSAARRKRPEIRPEHR